MINTLARYLHTQITKENIQIAVKQWKVAQPH